MNKESALLEGELKDVSTENVHSFRLTGLWDVLQFHLLSSLELSTNDWDETEPTRSV